MEDFAFLEEYSSSFGLNPAATFNSAADGVTSPVNWQSVLREILRFAGNTARETCMSVLLLIGVSMLAVFLSESTTREGQAMRKYALLVMVAVCAYPAVQDFLEMAEVARNGISNLTALMLAAVPALFSLHISVSSGVFLLITQITGALMLSVFLPMVLCQTALGICDSITERFKLSGIRQIVKSVFTWGLGTVMLVFGIVSALSGAVAGTGATVAGRSLRYAGSLIPVVGRYLSESAEMIYASASVLRSAGGIGVSMAVIACVLEPFVQILVYVLIYKLAAFCIRPFAENRIAALADAVGEGLSGLAGITILTASVALINIAVIVRSCTVGV